MDVITYPCWDSYNLSYEKDTDINRCPWCCFKYVIIWNKYITNSINISTENMLRDISYDVVDY